MNTIYVVLCNVYFYARKYIASKAFSVQGDDMEQLYLIHATAQNKFLILSLLDKS